MPETLHDGRYVLLEPLGQGASGMTWRARDERSGEVVVVKELFAALCEQEADRRREADMLSTLQHPCIPTFVEAFVAPVRAVPRLHLVMEYVEGTPLEAERQSRRYTVSEGIDVARQVLGILVYLQELSPPLVHRDVKPANLMRRKGEDTLVLLDFGLAVEGAQRTFGHTMAAGTLGYQAPEQIRGEPVPASDVYAVGVVLWTLLTRVEPHTRLKGQGLDWRPAATHLPASLVDWLDRALAPVERRFPSAWAALEALEADPPSRSAISPAPKGTPTSEQGKRGQRPSGTRRKKKKKRKDDSDEGALPIPVHLGPSRKQLKRYGGWLRAVFKLVAKLLDKLFVWGVCLLGAALVSPWA